MIPQLAQLLKEISEMEENDPRRKDHLDKNLPITVEKAKGSHPISGVDLGDALDFEAIYAMVKAALVKIEDKPEGAEEWDAIIWVRGSKGMGRALVIDLNPYKTWRW